jgi:tRNA/tmRNA/rRNA uracil-C5-methylase (TrmA/RlmC/RlmD family)
MSTLDNLLLHFKKNIDQKSFVKLIIANPKEKDYEIKSVSFKLINLKGQEVFNCLYKYKTKDITKNFSFDESVNKIKELLEVDFLNADLICTTETIHFLSNRKGNSKILVKKNKETINPTNLNHNKEKVRLIKTDKNIYLRELDILDSNFQLKPSKQDKFKQINKYLEIISHLLSDVKFDKNPSIVDMGSGKGYLTFAIYDYLVSNGFKDPKVLGVEFRKDMVDFCNKVAKLSDFKNLGFEKGTIEDCVLPEYNILIALHACDTATDDAIFKGIKNEAEIIVVAPCCHKQIRKQIEPNAVLKPLLSHGILLERQSEMITDSIRSLILEAYGYKTKVFEFIDAVHTPKNLMITAVKKKKSELNSKKLDEIALIKQQFGIKEHYLEKLLS